MITVKLSFYHRLDVNAIKGHITWVKNKNLLIEAWILA